MLQALHPRDYGGEAAVQRFRPASDQEPGRSHLLQPLYYWELMKRRALYFSIPFILVLSAGLAIAALLPATYVSVGKFWFSRSRFQLNRYGRPSPVQPRSGSRLSNSAR